MSTWTEYDPETGVTEINRWDEESMSYVVHKQQDVEPVLDMTRALANSGATDGGIKRGLWHYASVPVTVQYEMLTRYGVNVQNKHHRARVFDLINREYPYLKTTTKTHSYKHRG